MQYKPILEFGLHDISESDLGNYFLSDFPTSVTRPQLINNLKHYLVAVRSVGVKFEVWIDGSFTTEKIDLNDIDLVMFAANDDFDRLPEYLRKFARALVDNTSIRLKYRLDVFFADLNDIDKRNYWRGWYGFDREENPKGIARIWVRP